MQQLVRLHLNLDHHVPRAALALPGRQAGARCLHVALARPPLRVLVGRAGVEGERARALDGNDAVAAAARAHELGHLAVAGLGRRGRRGVGGGRRGRGRRGRRGRGTEAGAGRTRLMQNKQQLSVSGADAAYAGSSVSEGGFKPAGPAALGGRRPGSNTYTYIILEARSCRLGVSVN